MERGFALVAPESNGILDFHRQKIWVCGFKHFLSSSPFGEMIQIDNYFSDGWFNHQLEMDQVTKIQETCRLLMRSWMVILCLGFAECC